jgi:hypothetical protein
LNESRREKGNDGERMLVSGNEHTPEDRGTGEYFKATDSSESAGTVGTPINMERE